MATGADTYLWAGPDLSDITIANPVATPSVTSNYVVTGTDVNGCQNTDLVQVDVNPLPVITANPDLYIYDGECVALRALGGLSYLWTPAATLDIPTSDQPVACPGETTTYYVVGTDAFGCENIDSTVVYVIGIPIVEVPSAFTPNGDGLNDVFRIEKWLHFELTTLRVMNRWGDVVFVSNDILKGWDGTISGEEQPIGTYAYLVYGLDEKDAWVWRQGNVTLLR
jgi:gliding motility-associated-like protein